ncbi:MAG: proline--tRNA ligase [Nitrospira sp. SB0666_bin_27]|nr:proline--tRNA ligase [Nitrospira sp. SB0666_bin_27]MYF23996.1 proline--tRNA ligase [Nitrospira sp. SB0678_bin_10]
MRTSQLFIPTLRQTPGEAEVVSHRLMLRAGMIRKVAAGIYTYLPLGLRVLKKIESIIRQEMNRAGAQELLMPILSPAELWRETGRWDFYGKELLRCQDRHDRDFCFGPTHEEVITDLFRREVRSYRQLPMNCYQIQTKFRDEIRPRFGLMRGREFVMKDAYSFDADEESARLSYQKMYDAYERIFTRCGLKFRAVEADTGLIGGSMSHEFMVLAETGEETIVYDEGGSYAANVELAEAPPPAEENDAAPLALEAVQTPGTKTVEAVCTFLKVSPDRLVKTLLYQTPAGDVVAVLIRGDHEANAIKINRFLGTTEITLADAETVSRVSSAPVGFAGPVGLTGVRIIADHAVKAMRNFIVGGNKDDTHLINTNWDRDFTVEAFLDLRLARAGDRSPRSDDRLQEAKGIEVGHVFLLGTKYSQAMNATFLDADGQETLAIMGCYGIGVSRTAAASIEQNHDDKGMMWPVPIAPFHVHLLPVTASEQVVQTAGMLHDACLEAGVEVLWDDRDERAGVKFNDADLIGAPFHVTIGDRGLKQGVVELKQRNTGEVQQLPPADVIPHVLGFLSSYDLPVW